MEIVHPEFEHKHDEEKSNVCSQCLLETQFRLLKHIAKLAVKWGIATAELQVDPSKERRKYAISVAREMSVALKQADEMGLLEKRNSHDQN